MKNNSDKHNYRSPDKSIIYSDANFVIESDNTMPPRYYDPYRIGGSGDGYIKNKFKYWHLIILLSLLLILSILLLRIYITYKKDNSSLITHLHNVVIENNSDISFSPHSSNIKYEKDYSSIKSVNDSHLETYNRASSQNSLNIEDTCRIGIYFDSSEKSVYNQYFKEFLKTQNGLLILEVVPESPADISGLIKYDIIYQINGINIESWHDLSNVMNNCSLGDVIEIKAYRKEGKTVSSLSFNTELDNFTVNTIDDKFSLG